MTENRVVQTRAIHKRDVPAALATAILEGATACHYCADVLLPRQVDHVRPLSRGGTNSRSNLVAACIACNSQKRGMLVHEWRQWRESSGMSWPPVASHATVLRHYGDGCRECCHTASSGNSWPRHGWITTPHDLQLRDGHSLRYLGYYRCPVGHAWTCGWAIDTGYYSDCPCPWCVAKRIENNAESWPPMPRYGDSAPLSAASF